MRRHLCPQEKQARLGHFPLYSGKVCRIILQLDDIKDDESKRVESRQN